MKKFFISLFVFIFILVGALFGAIYFAHDWVLKVVLTTAVQSLTGFHTKIEGLHLIPEKGSILIEDLVLLNPRRFQERVFADIPEIYLQLDLPALLHKEGIHIPELRLNIQEFNVEKDPKGVSNLSLLKPAKKAKTETAQPAPAPKKTATPFYLDQLELTIRHVRYNDRSSLVPKKVSVDLHVDKQIFKGISDPKSIVNVILMKVVTAAPFGNLGVNPADLENQLRNSVNTARQFGGKMLSETQTKLLEQGPDVGKKIVDEGTQTISEVGGTAKKELTGLLGKIRSRINEESESK